MSLAEANKRLRYYRIQKLEKELRSYNLSSQYIEDALCSFFTIGPAVIYLALKHDPIKDVYYEHLDLDIKWAEWLAKKAISKRKNKPDKQFSNQRKLAL